MFTPNFHHSDRSSAVVGAVSNCVKRTTDMIVPAISILLFKFIDIYID